LKEGNLFSLFKISGILTPSFLKRALLFGETSFKENLPLPKSPRIRVGKNSFLVRP